MLPAMVEHDSEAGGVVGRSVSVRLGVSVRDYRELEAGGPGDLVPLDLSLGGEVPSASGVPDTSTPYPGGSGAVPSLDCTRSICEGPQDG
jgi:hypothetical protein